MTRPPAFIGIDGSSTGALVALADDGRTVLDLQQWQRDDAPALRVIPGDLVVLEGIHSRADHSSDSFAALAVWRARAIDGLPPRMEPPPAPRVPGRRISRKPDNKKAALMAFVGRLVESEPLPILRARLVAEGRILLLQPQPSTWRSSTGPRGKRKSLKAAALQRAHELAIGLPEVYPDHVAEAFLQAVFVHQLTQARRRAARRSAA